MPGRGGGQKGRKGRLRAEIRATCLPGTEQRFRVVVVAAATAAAEQSALLAREDEYILFDLRIIVCLC